MKQFTQICLITLLCLAFLKPGAVWAMSSEVQQIMLEALLYITSGILSGNRHLPAGTAKRT